MAPELQNVLLAKQRAALNKEMPREVENRDSFFSAQEFPHSNLRCYSRASSSPRRLIFLALIKLHNIEVVVNTLKAY